MPVKKDKGCRKYRCNFMLCGSPCGGTREFDTESSDDFNKTASINRKETRKLKNTKLGLRAKTNKLFHRIWDCIKGRCLKKQASDTEINVAGEQSILTPRTLSFTVEETQVRDTDIDVVKAPSVSTSLSFTVEEAKLGDTDTNVTETQSALTTLALPFREEETQVGDTDIGVTDAHSALTTPSLSFTEEDSKVEDTDIDVVEAPSFTVEDTKVKDRDIEPVAETTPSSSFTAEKSKVGDTDIDVVKTQSFTEETEGYSSSTGSSASTDTAFDATHTDFSQCENPAEAVVKNNSFQGTLRVEYVPVPPNGPPPKRGGRFYRLQRYRLAENVDLSVPHKLDTPPDFPTFPKESSRTVIRKETKQSAQHSGAVAWQEENPFPAWPEDPQEPKSPEVGKKQENTEQENPTPDPISYPLPAPVGLIPNCFPVDKHNLPQVHAPRKIGPGYLPCRPVTPRLLQTGGIAWQKTNPFPAWQEDSQELKRPEVGKEQENREQETPNRDRTPNPINYPAPAPVGLIPNYFPVDKHNLPQVHAPREIGPGYLPCRPVTRRSLQTVPKNRNFEKQMRENAEQDQQILDKTPLFMKAPL